MSQAEAVQSTEFEKKHTHLKVNSNLSNSDETVETSEARKNLELFNHLEFETNLLIYEGTQNECKIDT